MLRERNYRRYFLGQLVSNTGTWTQLIAQNWLVLTLTGSTLAVGITLLAQSVPLLLFALQGGALADRVPKRTLLLWTQTLLAVLAAALAALTLSGQVRAWQIDVLALLTGLVTAADTPTRQAFLPELVHSGQVKAAASLTMANWHASRMTGPALAAMLITTAGSGWAFTANAVSFVPSIATLLAVHPHKGRAMLRETGPPWPTHGWQHVRHNRPLLKAIMLLAVLGIFGDSALAVLLPGLSLSTFHSDASWYGLMNSSAAAGAIVGALTLARGAEPPSDSRTRILFRISLGFAASLLVAAMAPQAWTFALALLLVGATGTAYYIVGYTVLHASVPTRRRGKAMSMFVLATEGGAPISGPLIGWLSTQTGSRTALTTCGAICLTTVVLLGQHRSPRPDQSTEPALPAANSCMSGLVRK